MRTLLASAGLALLLALATEPSVSAQEAPEWMKQTLIALGVAAQIPCAYCVYGHTKLAKKPLVRPMLK